MKMYRYLTLALVLTGIFTVTASAQRRRTPKKPTPKPPATSTVSPLEVRAAKEKVSNQKSNVERFVAALRPIAQSIADVDADIAARKASKGAVDTNNANKQKVITAIRNLHDGLSALEAEFQSKPALRKYLLKIEGIAGLGGQSEDLAAAGRFTDADAPLIRAGIKLQDTLAAMP